MGWRRLEADGCEWEVRALAAEAEGHPSALGQHEEVLEFRPVAAIRPPRRTVMTAGVLDGLSDAELMSAYRRARPIGGDHYGRPGKRMPDTAQ